MVAAAGLASGCQVWLHPNRQRLGHHESYLPGSGFRWGTTYSALRGGADQDAGRGRVVVAEAEPLEADQHGRGDRVAERRVCQLRGVGGVRQVTRLDAHGGHPGLLQQGPGATVRPAVLQTRARHDLAQDEVGEVLTDRQPRRLAIAAEEGPSTSTIPAASALHGAGRTIRSRSGVREGAFKIPVTP